MKYTLYYTSQAKKDAKKLKSSKLAEKVKKLLLIIANDPFETIPPYEKLVGDLSGAYSRRINIQHRLIYEVIEDKNAVKILRMWTHYD